MSTTHIASSALLIKPYPRYHYFGVIVLLSFYLSLALSDALQLSIAFDETPHLTAGISYWLTHDYRLHPENGLLPQYWAALPSYWSNPDFKFQQLSGWSQADVWKISQQTLFNTNFNFHALLVLGRGMIIGLGLLLGLLVYQWSKQLYGQTAALLSLCLYCFSPTLLAHSSLITSDLTFTFFLLLSTALWWQVLHRLQWWSLLCCGLAVGALFLSKLSAVLFIPSALMIAILRLIVRKPWTVSLHQPIDLIQTKQHLYYFGFVTISIGLIAWGVIWFGYGFRYSLSPDSTASVQLYDSWSQSGLLGAVIGFFAHHHLLPEAYLYGISFVSKHIERIGFLQGQYSFLGWWYFFPYAFWIKTPLPTLGIILWGSLFAVYQRLPMAALLRAYYQLIPLLALLAVYLIFAVTSTLNIGHRHILPIYPVIFILCGSLVTQIKHHKYGVLMLCSLILWLGIETIHITPNHLSFFNQTVGGPKQGYRHLVDSSLDWGQNLPQLYQWLEQNQLNRPEKPAYLAYFGSVNPQDYHINIKLLPGYIDRSHYQKHHQPIQELTAGTYIVSATILQAVYMMIGELGPWTQQYENSYQQLRHRSWVATQQWDGEYFLFRNLQLARLCAYLRQRAPDTYIGYSLLVYQLDTQEIEQALSGPAVELFATDQVLRPTSIQAH